LSDIEAPNTNDLAAGQDGTGTAPDATGAGQGATGAEPDGKGGEGRGGPTESAAADPAALQRKLELLSAQLDESFARARDGQAKLKEEHERLLRTAAELENYKRRAAKEKEETRKYGTESLLKDFLPVADNLERALEHASQHDPRQVLEGIRLVQKMLDTALAKHGVVGFSAVGQPFDPGQHEALMQAESDEAPGTVVKEMARGYRLHDRLVRPAAVVVAKARDGSSSGPAAGVPQTPPADVGKN
jgi:molecular chaperone GrpE